MKMQPMTSNVENAFANIFVDSFQTMVKMNRKTIIIINPARIIRPGLMKRRKAVSFRIQYRIQFKYDSLSE